MSERALSKELKECRTDRPDEWKMDEFIRKAIALEMKVEVYERETGVTVNISSDDVYRRMYENGG
jgi:tRNA pseudouridine-54 N-methylase